MFKIHEKFLKILLTLQGRFGLISAVAQIAQSVEQRIENPCVPGSIPGLGTIKVKWCRNNVTITDAQIAQSVEQRIENPCVPGSIPGLGTTYQAALAAFFVFMLLDTDTRFRASHLMPSWAALSPAVTLSA